MDAEREWVIRWAEEYQRGWDAVLDDLAGKPTFTADDLTGVYAWKYKGLWAGRKIKAMRDGRVRSWPDQ